MQLDSFTVLAAGFALLALLGSIFVFLWARERNSPWLLWWGVPFIVGGAALAFYMRPGWDSDFASILIGNILRMVAVGCLWQGVRLFQRRPLLLWPLAAVAIGWIGLCFVPAFMASMLTRIVVVSLVNALFCGLAAHELWRDRSEQLPSRRPTMLVFVSFTMLMLLRAGVAAFTPFPVGELAANSAWLGFFMFLVFAHCTFAAVLFIAMTNERREAEQRSFAMSDPLTGLLNRRGFADFADRMNRRNAGSRSGLSLMVLDLDHFKSINDRFGHEVGDRILKAFAEVSESSVRTTDQLFRMGGEEFCFVLPDTSLADAIKVAERVRISFEAGTIEAGEGIARATVSIGIAATQHHVGMDVLLAAADAAVYEAKARGRNRIVVAEPATLRQSRVADIVAPERRSA
ncbi:MAG: diguanylate cyclase [Devosia nanyangense]|uniref:diguanylate cyclase n=1 Tax=Devosia nanyangense TaxID=1228055 RepID=A0A933NXY6_9HYPH|nr:diguanylate cyclase [Devosia nanyangense]